MLANMKLEGFNWKEMARYLRMCGNPGLWAKWRVKKYLPVRVHSKGSEPGIFGAEAQGPHSDSEQCEFPNLQINNHDIKTLLAASQAIAAQETFKSHVYSFGGKLYQQLLGGPIGLRITTVIAKIRMASWLRHVKFALKKAGIEVWMTKLYVDDVRLVVSEVPRGHGWRKGSNTPEYLHSEEGAIRDIDDDFTYQRRTANKILELMNMIEPDLEFTIELEEDFPNGKIPTLDFSMWLGEGPSEYHPPLLYEANGHQVCGAGDLGDLLDIKSFHHFSRSL